MVRSLLFETIPGMFLGSRRVKLVKLTRHFVLLWQEDCVPSSQVGATRVMDSLVFLVCVWCTFGDLLLQARIQSCLALSNRHLKFTKLTGLESHDYNKGNLPRTNPSAANDPSISEQIFPKHTSFAE